MADNNLSRKNFLKIAGGSTAVALGLAGCELNSIPPEPEPKLNLGPDPRPDDFAVYLGSGDTGLFNFIYAVTQLEAAFFIKAMNSSYDPITPAEKQLLSDIRDHKIVHRNFYNEFLGDNGIQGLNFEFFSTDFSSRQSVLEMGRLIEDVGVSMYNIIGELFENPDYLNTIIKIVSVEARHASAFRILQQPASTYFIGDDIITPNGLDAINIPGDVARLLFPFIIEKLDFTEVPRP